MTDRCSHRMTYNYRIIVKLGYKAHSNIWLFIEFIQSEDLQMQVKVESIILYVGRSRTKEMSKDFMHTAIAIAKCIYL